jgi:hypothetical protein
LRVRFYFLFYCGFGECERMSMVARRGPGPGCPQKMCVYSHPAHPAMEMQDTFHCFLGVSSSGYTTLKALKRMLPLGVPNRSTTKVDTRGSSSSHQVSAPPFQNLFGPPKANIRKSAVHARKTSGAYFHNSYVCFLSFRIQEAMFMGERRVRFQIKMCSYIVFSEGIAQHSAQSSARVPRAAITRYWAVRVLELIRTGASE